LQNEIHFANAYWQTIRPFIVGRESDFVEFEITLKAKERVGQTLESAKKWNAGQWPMGHGKLNGDDGPKFPVVTDGIPKPIDHPKLKALPLINSLLGTFVTFAEIMQSNSMASGRLALLPALQIKRKGRKEKDAADEPLSLKQIKAEVAKFLKKFSDAYDDPKDNGTKEYKLAREDSMMNNRIELKYLCKVRWERFKEFSHAQRRRALKREANKRVKRLAAAKPADARKRKK
jgi:hypothetical protein